MELAQEYLRRHATPFQAYIELQRSLMRRYINRGGTPQQWCESLAPVYARTFRWMLEQN